MVYLNKKEPSHEQANFESYRILLIDASQDAAADRMEDSDRAKAGEETAMHSLPFKELTIFDIVSVAVIIIVIVYGFYSAFKKH